MMKKSVLFAAGIVLGIVSLSVGAQARSFDVSCHGSADEVDTTATAYLKANSPTAWSLERIEFKVVLDSTQEIVTEIKQRQVDSDDSYVPQKQKYKEMSRFLLAQNGWMTTYLLMPAVFGGKKKFIAYVQRTGHDAMPTIKLYCTSTAL